jgi:predicted metalloprotease
VANPVYDQAIAPVPCEVGDIDLTSAPIGDIQAYMTNLVACLMDSWDNAVEGAGFVLPRPSITVYDAEIMTKCGESISLNAFYCSADQQMYYSYDLVQLFSWDLQRARYVAEAVIAHEFGHAVQGRTGILESEDYRAADAATEEESYEWSRRAELQADCFAGLFLRSIAASTGMLDSDHENARQVFYQLGDPYVGGDHGQPDSRSAWFESGFGSDSVGACRTYDAASESVT